MVTHLLTGVFGFPKDTYHFLTSTANRSLSYSRHRHFTCDSLLKNVSFMPIATYKIQSLRSLSFTVVTIFLHSLLPPPTHVPMRSSRHH